MIVEALTEKQEKYLKQISTLVINPNYPGLNLEKLVPNSMGLYSFRLDIHYRVVFRYVNEHIKIISITNHYH